MIVRNGSARLFPNLLLRIQVGSSHREIDNLKARVCRQEIAYRASPMPGCAIPEQEDWTVREGVEDQLEMSRASSSVQFLKARNHFTPTVQVECAIESNFGSAGVNAHDEGVANRRPSTHSGCLQVHPGFVLTQNKRFGCILSHIDQFFSAM